MARTKLQDLLQKQQNAKKKKKKHKKKNKVKKEKKDPNDSSCSEDDSWEPSSDDDDFSNLAASSSRRPQTRPKLKRVKQENDSETESQPEYIRKQRFRPGVRAAKEVKQYQLTTQLLIKKLPFQRIVRGIAKGYSEDIRFAY